MRDQIEAALASPALRTKGARALLEALRDCERGGSVARGQARAALGKREGKPVSDAAFGQRLKRLNDELKRASPPFRIVSDRGALRLDDGTPKLEARLAERSRKETLREGVGKQAPRGMPDTLWVLFSYGWQSVAGQHQAQLDLYERVRHILDAKPPEFVWLPKIELWRDAERLEKSHGANAQIEAACDRAFLALVMMSLKYPNSPGCMMEFDRFVDAKGDNLSGKSAILVAVNCKRDDVDRRFSDGLRLWMDDGGRTLVESIRRSEAAKHAFAKAVAKEIWLAAARYLGGPDAGEKPAEEPDPTDPVADFISRRLVGTPGAKHVPPLARKGAMGAQVAAEGAGAGGNGEGADILKHLTDWAERRDGPRMTALLGDFGMGKTVTCQMLTQRLLERRKADPQRTPLPIYLDPREIRDAKSAGTADLETLMADMLRRVGEAPLDPREVIRYAREKGALVIFDGLDELTNKLSRSEAEQLYRTILRIVPDEDWAADRDARRAMAPRSVIARSEATKQTRGRLTAAPGLLRFARNDEKKRGRPTSPPPVSSRKGPLLLVSCRTHYFPDIATQRAFLIDKDRAGLDAGADVEIWFMLPFNPEQIESCLKQNLGEADGARALEMIASTYNLTELSTRPILLKFFADTFRELEQQKLKGLTVDIGRMYETFVDQTLARDGGKHVIPLREKKWLLAELALHMHIEGVNQIANDDLDVWLSERIEAEPALRKLQWGADGEDALSRFELFLQDLRNATLLVRPGDVDFRFGHTSVREFFLAEALHRHVREGRLDNLGGVAVNDETVDFLLARQRNGASTPDARRFREQWPRLLERGRSAHLRWFAVTATWRAGGDLPWPEIADFSGFDLMNFVFAASGVAEPEARKLPPLAIWRGARLHGAKFFGLELRGQDFSGADASGSFWFDCDFSGAGSDEFDLRAAEFRSCTAEAPLAASAITQAARWVACRGALAVWNHRPLATKYQGPYDRNAAPVGPILAIEIVGIPAPTLAFGCRDNTIRLWSPRSGETLRVLEGHRNTVASLAAIEIDGKPVLASGSYDNTIRLWNPRNGDTLRVLEGHTDAVGSLAAIETDGKPALASGSHDDTIRLWNPRSGETLRVLEEGHTGSVASLAAIEIDGKPALASGSDDDTIRLWNPRSGETLRVLEEGHTGSVASLAAIEIDGKPALASGSDDDTIRLWNPRSGETLRVLEGHKGYVASLAAIEIDGKPALASGSYDNTIRLWNTRSGETLRVLEGHTGYVASLAAIEVDGKPALASGSRDNTLRLWNPRSGETLRVLGGHTDSVASLAAIEVDGKSALASGSDDNAIRLWNTRSGETLRVLDGHRSSVASLAAIEIDGKPALVSGSWDKTVRLWNKRSGETLRVLEGHTGSVASLAAIEIDGEPALASGSWDNTIKLWNTRTGETLRVLEGHTGYVVSLAAIEIDGKPGLASGSWDNTIRLWNKRSGDTLRVLEGHTSFVASLAAIEIDGKPALASGSWDNTIRLWDQRSGETLRILEGHTGPLASLAAIEIDGKPALASGSWDKTIKLWNPRSGGWLASFDPHLGGASFAVGATGDGLLAFGPHIVLSIDAASLAALVARRGVVTERRFALNPGYSGSFVETKRDAATGELLQATVGRNAWRDFIAVGYEADGRQTVRPIEDMATAASG